MPSLVENLTCRMTTRSDSFAADEPVKIKQFDVSPGWSNRLSSAAAASEGVRRTSFGTSKVRAMREQSWRPVSPSWQANGQTKRCIYDGEDILLEYDGSNALQARYTHGPGIDEPIAVTKAGSTFFYHQDGLGSVTDLTDSTGVTTKSYAYDAYGNIVDQTGTVDQPYTYTGREFDSETGLYYYRARYYDSMTGRFLQNDPTRFLGGDNNFYSYARGNPINLTDPFGLRPLTIREKKCLRLYFPQVDLDNADLHDGEVPWYLLPGYDGITRGNDIYLRPGVYDSGGIGVLGHELYHVGQYRQGKTWIDFVIEGLNGHDNSPLEIPAMVLEREIREDLQSPNGVYCPCAK